MPAKPEATTTLGLERFAPEAKALVAGAQALADERKHAEVQPLHFLARALERDPGVLEVFRRAASNSVELAAAVERSLASLPKSKEPAYLAPAMLDLLERAEREAERERSRTVQLEHLLNALSQEIRGPAGELLGAFGVAPGSLRAHVAALRETPRAAPQTSTAVVPVEQYTRGLVEDARRGDADPV